MYHWIKQKTQLTPKGEFAFCIRLYAEISLKVIGTDTVPSATYHLLLAFYSNYGTISYRFRDKRRYLLNFPTTLYLAPPLGEFPLEYCNGGGSKKTRMSKKCDDTSIRLDTVPALDTQTDRQTDRQIGKIISRSAWIACRRATHKTINTTTTDGWNPETMQIQVFFK